MTPEQWQKAKVVFESAIERPAGERRAFVAGQCADDDIVRREVESLLDVYAEPGGFSMETPLVPLVLGRRIGAVARDDNRAAPECGRLLIWRCAACGALYPSGTPVCPSDGEVVSFSPPALVGQVLDGDYRIERVVGSGSMGTVFLATWQSTQMMVSIKVLSPYLFASEAWAKRFLREARTTARIGHPGVVEVFDHRVTDGTLAYLVQEYLDGKTVRQTLDERGPFPVSEALRIVGRLAPAIDAIHACGLVHRDVKPENVMLVGDPDDPTVKLLDLGIAKVLKDSVLFSHPVTTLTSAGQQFGTPHYMAPELWVDPGSVVPNEVDGRADVYSLGALTYEMLSGKRAFPGDTIDAVRRSHLEGEPGPLWPATPGVSRDLDRAVARAVAARRDDRYPSAGAFAADVERLEVDS